MIDALSLKVNQFFNIKEHNINGFHETEVLQSPEPAKNESAIMVRGILIVNWKQSEVYKYINHRISKL